MSVTRLLREMDSAEIAEWRAFFLVRDEEMKRQRLQAGAQAGAERTTQQLRRRNR
jgi:hypothetical protein